MTQEDIARECRVAQSMVSRWSSGHSLASEASIQPLVAKYGSKLNRTSSRIYLLSGTGPETPKIVRVEGPVIFRYVFWYPVTIEERSRKRVVKEAVARWFIHRLPQNRLVFVRQKRRFIPASKFPSAADESLSALSKQLGLRGDWVQCADDQGRWESKFFGPCTHDELLARLDQEIYSEDVGVFGESKTKENPTDYDIYGVAVSEHFRDVKFNPHDRAVLPFLIRKSFVEHGFVLPEVLHFPAHSDIVE